MNQFFPSAITALLAGTLDLLADPITVAPYSNVTYDEHWTTVADLDATRAVPVDAVALDARSVDGRTLLADDVTFPAIPEDWSVSSLVLSRTGDGLLVAWIDRRADLAPMFVQGTGGPVTFSWGAGTVVRL